VIDVFFTSGQRFFNKRYSTKAEVTRARYVVSFSVSFCCWKLAAKMYRFGSLNPGDYGGMPSMLSHVHDWRRENTAPDPFACFGKGILVSSRLREVGKPLQKHGENQAIQVAVEKFVNDLLNCVGRLEGRFISTVIPSGSFYEGTKITAPNEFDFMAEIQVLSFRGACTLHWHSAFPGRPLVKVHPFLAATLFPDLLCGSAKSISSSSFRNAFEKTLQNALGMVILPPCFESSIRIGQKGPSITLVLTWRGQKYKNLDISIDITPAIKFFHWPQWTDMSATAPSARKLRGLSASRESYSKRLKEQVTKLGFHVVPVSPLWRGSFSIAEMHILRRFSPESNRLTCYRCAKYFRDHHRGDKKVLSSYILKTAFLFELERYPEDEFWTSEELFPRLHGMMNRLQSESKEELLGSYFVSSFAINEKWEAIIPYAIQRILEDLNLLMLLGPEARCCHQEYM